MEKSASKSCFGGESEIADRVNTYPITTGTALALGQLFRILHNYNIMQKPKTTSILESLTASAKTLAFNTEAAPRISIWYWYGNHSDGCTCPLIAANNEPVDGTVTDIKPLRLI